MHACSISFKRLFMHAYVRMYVLTVLYREEMKQLKFFLKREVTKTMRYQSFSERLVGQLEKTQWDESRKVSLLHHEPINRTSRVDITCRNMRANMLPSSLILY